MSTTGILRPDEVVFYHPCDDFVEHTIPQAWTGAAGFTGGKLPAGSPVGLSGVTGDAYTFGVGNAYDTNNNPTWQCVDKLDADRMIVGYAGNSPTDGGVRVATLSGTDITYGPAASIQYCNNEIDVVALSATQFVVAFTSSTYSVKCVAGTVSGTDVTLGSIESCWSGQPVAVWVGRLTSSTALVLSNPENQNLRGVVVTVTGLDATVAAYSDSGVRPHKVSWGQGWDASVIDSSRVLVCLSEYPDTLVKGMVATISGSDVTWGPTQAMSSFPYTQVAEVACEMLTSSTFLVGFHRQQNGFTIVGTVSGTSITTGAWAYLWSGSAGLNPRITISKIDSTHAFATYSMGDGGKARTITVSGLSSTLGGVSEYRSVSDGWNHALSQAAAAVDSTRAMVVYSNYIDPGNEGVGKVGMLAMEATMEAPTPGAYPSVVGATRFVVAMWARNLTKGSSAVKVKRGFEFLYTNEDDLSLIISSPGSVEWTAAGLGTILNDGGGHLLVVDIEHEGGGVWRLRTSVDGDPFVDRGTGAGTEPVPAADTAPGVSIENSESGQWVDELIMWAGDKTVFGRFTSEELANLRDLAETFGEGMGEYEQNYGAPICWQATAKLPDGTVWRDSRSGPCPAVVRVPRGAADIIVTDDGKAAKPRIQEG